ncbi:Kae1-associated serine/threonine protein kinase [bacterium]|nr:Kae1-associated serine/threonine protein kinase [bacterium]
MSKQTIAQGAEAILTIDTSNQTVQKHRISKGYRLPLLDNKIRKQRTKKEAKLLEKASKIIPIPKIINLDEKQQIITLEYIDGKRLSDHLDNLPNAIQVCNLIGKQIALLHNNDIIHGDLTTSNMILQQAPPTQHTQNSSNKSITPNNTGQECNLITSPKLFFIDFGLGFTSKKPEDKAVDLHLIKQALEAKHFKHFKEFFKAIEQAYKTHSNNAEQILNRLNKVEKRGRYKGQY